MADVGLCAASTVAGCLVAPVDRLCGYVISYDSHVCELEDKVAELGHARERVQDSIDDAKRNTKCIKDSVNKWVEDVENHTEEVRRVLDDKAKITCFCGWLPNPKVRYRLGREARRKAERIRGLINRTPPGKVYDDPPPGLVDGTSNMISSAGDRGYTNFDSQASILEDIMNALGDEKHKVIGIYGEGGVGKTTLLKQVEEKLRIEKRLFRMILKSNVSQNPDFKKIQDNFAFALDLKNLKDETSEEGRKELLFKRLQNDPSEKVLIILDDLWKDLDLGAVGIPSKDESKGCKLLLTSRFKDVLEQMECHNSIFHLQGLKDDEAFRLFEKKVGDRLKDDEDLKTIADQLVKKLAGLPLLIISVANFLKDKDKYAWRTARIEIDESNKETKETIVKLSYNHLKSEDAKTLFLLCGLIGGTIQVETLLVLGMGLGLFGEFRRTMQKSRDRLNTILDELRSACLLLDGGDDKNNVTIHDLYSEMVVSTPFRGQNSLMMNSNYGSWPKEKLEKCWAICLADVDKRRLDELMECQFPDLKMLILSQPKGWRWKQEHECEVGDCSGLFDFTYMKELRVLYFEFMHSACFPPSIGILENLHSLYLRSCKVEDVAILGKLKALQILSFVGSTIFRLPKEIGKLTNLRSLNLSKCDSLEIIQAGTLKGLINLEELHMKESLVPWMGKHEKSSESCVAGLAELKSLTKLASLEISIPDPIILLEDGDLPVENLDKFWINIGHGKMEYEGLTTMNLNLEGCDSVLSRKWVGHGKKMEYEGLTTMNLNLEGCDSVLSRKWVKKNLHKTQCLYLSKLSEFKESPRELCTQGFQEVRYLHIKDSPSIKYIADSSNGLPLTAFGKLESFFLENLINLEKICHGPVAPECFNKLKAVRVKECDQLKYLWCLSDVQKLVQLEEIEVWKCDSMQSIVTHDAGEDIVSTNNKVELPNVRRLVLNELPNMTSFCNKAEMTSEDIPIQVSLPRLESLVMVGLLGLEKILYSEPLFKYNNLKSLKIEESKSTSIILKDWILKLPNLESMAIKGTPFVEVVFDLEELKVIEEVEILSRLSTLALSKLPNLWRMWKQDVQLQGISILQNLKKLSINNTRLSFLFLFSMDKCLREIREIKVEDCQNMKAVIVDEEGRHDGTDDIIEFPLLERLSISHCPTEKFFSYHHGKKESITTTSDSKDTYSDSFFNQKVSLPSLQELLLKSVGSFKRIWCGVLPKSSFDKLANLTFSRCSDQLDVFSSTNIGRLHNLRSVEVLECPSLESLFDFGSLDSYTEQTIELLPKLKEVTIASCPSLESLFSCGSLDSNMEHKIVLLPRLKRVAVSEAGRLRQIVLSDSHMVFGFPSLKNVGVNNCSELRYLFPYYTATTLDKLKFLAIINCKQMKEVVPKEEGGRSKAKVMSFPSLITLIIWCCPNLGAFIRSPTSVERQLGEMIEENDESIQPLFNDMVTFPNMRGLGIKGVQCKELWNDQIPDDSFCNLKSLKLKGCDNLQCIAPSHMWKRLQRCLKTLEVKSCRLIKIIYESDGTVAKSGNLMRLILCDLDNLRHIWRYDSLPNIPFPSLRYVKAIRCSRLEMLFATSTVKFLEQIKELVVGSCEDMELIAGHEECEEAAGTTITFSKLNTLRLRNLPKFKSFLPENYSMKFPSLDKLDQSSESEDESDGESLDESDGESEDESDSEIELNEIEIYLESSESVSEEESEDEEVMGKLRTKVIEERELS